MLAVLGVGVVVVLVGSRVVTDRYEWSQWVWWVPAGWFVVMGWGLLVGSLFCWIMSRRRGGSRRGAALRWVLLIGCLGMMMYVAFGVRRWQNVIGGYGIHWTRVLENGRVRVLHWNLSAGKVDVERFMGWVNESHADVILIANARWDGQRGELIEGLEGVFGEGWTVRRVLRGVVVSRFEILEMSTVTVSASGGEGVDDDAMRATGDFGWVVKMSLDGGDRFGEFGVWFVDLPSEPTVHRMESMGRVVESLRVEGRDERPALKPALIIGDFNTVRGSASLGLFDEFDSGDGYVDAFDARGALGGSWRPTGLTGLQGWAAGRSSWHIDLSLVGNGWWVDGYELLMPDGAVWGEGVSHKAQVVDIFQID